MIKSIGKGLLAASVSVGCLSANAALFKDWSASELKQKRGYLYNNLPFSFQIPVSRWADVDLSRVPITELTEEVGGDPSSSLDDVGLRVLTISKRSGDHEKAAIELAEKGILKTGDVLVKSMVASKDAGMYYQLQSGATHSGLIVVDEIQYRGQRRKIVFNIDMPAYESGNLNTAEYTTSRTAPVEHYHIFRNPNLTEAERENIRKWAMEYHNNRNFIYKGGARRVNVTQSRGGHRSQQMSFNGRYGFNSNYSVSFFDDANGDFDLMVLRAASQVKQTSTRGRNDYCSGWVMSAHLMKTCDFDYASSSDKQRRFDQLKDQIMNQQCVQPQKMFSPMTMFSASNGTPGLTDGPMLALKAVLEHTPRQNQQQVVDGVMGELFARDADPDFRSSHRDTALAIDALKPQIQQYYGGVLSGQLPHGEPIAQGISAQLQNDPQAEGVLGLLNARNYPPAAFIINAMLPDSHPQKKFEYVMTFDFDDRR